MRPWPGGLSLRRDGAGRRLQIALLAVVIAASLAVVTGQPGWQLLNYRVFDYLSTLAPPERPSESPVIVAIDEPSFAEVGLQWPWPRSLHARLIEQLRAAGARAIGVDIIFSEPAADPANDEALAAALGPDVVLAADESLITTPQADQLLRTMPLPILTDAGAAAGIASVVLHGDGVVRELPALDDSFAARLSASTTREVTLPAEGELMQVFGGPRTYETVSYYQALDPEAFLPEGLFRDRVVIIGLSLQNAPAVAAGGADTFATSFTPRTGLLTAGAEVHATIFDNLRMGLGVAPVSEPLRYAALLLSVCLATLLIWKGTDWSTVATSMVAITAIAIASYLTLRFGRIYVPPIAPALAFFTLVATQSTIDYASERRIRRQVTNAFRQYLSPDLVRQLAEDPSRLKLGGEKRQLSVLFCDVRGFTTIAEAMKDEPEQLTQLVNRLLTPLSDVILSHGGTIDKYIGDCIMAFWNAPLDHPDHAFAAVSAALDMLDVMDALNAELMQEALAEGRPMVPLRIGIGINTGDCVVGNMGSTQRFDYSALGDAVNLASRLEGASKQFGVPILLGEVTTAMVSSRLPVFELDRITVKGRNAALAVATAIRHGEAGVDPHALFVAADRAGDIGLRQELAKRLETEFPPLAAYYRQKRQPA